MTTKLLTYEEKLAAAVEDKFPRCEQEHYHNFDPVTGLEDLYLANPKSIAINLPLAIELGFDYKIFTKWQGKPTSVRIFIPAEHVNLKFIKKPRTISKAHKAALDGGRKAK